MLGEGLGNRQGMGPGKRLGVELLGIIFILNVRMGTKLGMALGLELVFSVTGIGVSDRSGGGESRPSFRLVL
jgi:hypothetical protein